MAYDQLNVDFSQEARNLVREGLGRLVSRLSTSCVLRQFLAVFLDECQELYDACIAAQKERTIHAAASYNLEALGRIVGQQRAGWTYDDSTWFKFDTSGQSFDQAQWWCTNASIGSYVPANDTTYRMLIIARIVKNHTLVASIPEITTLVPLLLGFDVSFKKTGPYKVQLYVPDSISKTDLFLLVNSITNNQVDNTYMLPYPVTLSLEEHVIFVPSNTFMFDKVENHQWDAGNWAIGSLPSPV